MILKDLFNYLNQFFFYLKNKIRNLYLNSSIYNKKISQTIERSLEYKPSPSLLDCLIKYKKKKNKIEDFILDSIWQNKDIGNIDYKKLHCFFWLFSLDLKSSKKSTQSIILKWIETNDNYNHKNWDIDILSKRVIAWISNSKLTYDESDQIYKNKFNKIIQKQINHLINEIERSNWLDDKMIGCAAIILAGLSYKEKSQYLNFGFSLLKKIIKLSFNNEGFPKSRNIRQLNFYLKYFVLIREWLKESQTDIPEYIDENIFYLGQAYSLIYQNTNKDILFNGNQRNLNDEFNVYLARLGYKFKNENNEAGGYAILKNKKNYLIMDVGPSPEKKFSSDYQAGALSFEIFSANRKLVSNSGYFQDYNHQLNYISKTTATHSTLIIDDSSSCKFNKNSNKDSKIEQNLKILKKTITSEKNYWCIEGAHDGYVKKYGIVHNRKIEFYPESERVIGNDSLIKKKDFKSLNFEIRFHLEPDIKIMKTKDGKSIFIELDNEGWKFICSDYRVDIENGLYFGKKNSYIENKNICISGMTQNKNQCIRWEFIKIV